MLTLIDRYIAKLFLSFFFAGLAVFLTLYVVVDTTALSVQQNVPANVLIAYYGYSLPMIIYQMMPVACLVGTLFTLISMGRANELTALFSAGLSLARVSAPILALVAALSALNFGVGDWLVPAFTKKKNYVYFVEIKKQPGLYSTVKTNKIWYRSQNILFNIKTLNAERKLAQDATFYYFDDEWNLIQLINAKELNINNRQWELKKGTLTLFFPESSFPLTKTFDEKTITINEDLGDLQSTSNATDVMRSNELWRFIRKNKEAGLDTLRYEVDYHGKFSFAFAAFVMSFLGIPFSVGRARSGGWAIGVGLVLGLAFVYWGLYSSGLTLGRHGVVPPIVAAWASNLLMLAVGLGFLLRLKR
ncbi:MAG: LPS export ABC transporter permease LptG [Bdellovibrionia bacterium]